MLNTSSSQMTRTSVSILRAPMYAAVPIISRRHQFTNIVPRAAAPQIRCQRRALHCRASAAAISIPGSDYATLLNRKNTLAPLPPPPKASTLFTVLPYLCRLALEERSLLWRFGLSFACMVVSKSAGKTACPLIGTATFCFILSILRLGFVHTTYHHL